MLRIGDLNNDKVLTITASGTLTRQDYDEAMPDLQEMLDQHGKLRFYIELEDCSGIRPAALWEELKFDMKYRDRFGKTAVVGDKKWEEWVTKLSRLIMNDEIRFFYTDRRNDAWEWINH